MMRAVHIALVSALALLPARAGAIPGAIGPSLRGPIAGGGDPLEDFVDAMMAAGTVVALYVVEDPYIDRTGDVITQIDDLSGNGHHLTPAGTGPDFSATGGPASTGGAVFAGNNAMRNSSWAAIDGTRVGVVFVGAWTSNLIWDIGYQFGTNFYLYERGDGRWGLAAPFEDGFQDVNSDISNDEAGHCHALWMFAGSNDAEVDGVAYTNDIAGNALLDVGTNTLAIGRNDIGSSVGTASLMVVYDAPDTGTRTAVDAAVDARYGVPCD